MAKPKSNLICASNRNIEKPSVEGTDRASEARSSAGESDPGDETKERCGRSRIKGCLCLLIFVEYIAPRRDTWMREEDISGGRCGGRA